MIEGKTVRLSQAARKLNVGTATIVAHLVEKGVQLEDKPHVKITLDQFDILVKEFATSAIDKEEASEIVIGKSYLEHLPSTDKNLKPKPKEPSFSLSRETISPQVPGANQEREPAQDQEEKPAEEPTSLPDLPAKDEPKAPAAAPKAPKVIEKIMIEKPKSPTVLGKMELPPDEEKIRQVASSDSGQRTKRRPRKRIVLPALANQRTAKKAKREKESISEKEIKEKIKSTLAELSKSNAQESSRAKYRKEKKSAIAEAQEEELLRAKERAKTLRVTEFISSHDLASLLGVAINDVISTCMSLGIVASINQRLDAEAITLIADEFGYQVEFVATQDEELEEEEKDNPEDLVPRAPVVTIMGHVDHGKTSLLDYIRNTEVTKGEAGGITQHIGAYDVVTKSGKRVAFLDTPGHEAFTAMRARGAKITDIVIIVVAADDEVMPQTKEAINHAQVARAPIVIAINKVDKPEANPNKIKKELAGVNILVEEWGGKYQSQAISAKTGQGVDELLEKVLLEAEILELKANLNKKAKGRVIEASLDQGQGYVATLMVQSGTLKVSDVVLAGAYYGKVKTIKNHQGSRMQKAIPSTPVQVLGLNGAPQAGDAFRVTNTDREARDAATQRQKILREQSLRANTRITLDEISRRLAIGNFKQLNLILKGDVDGSIEALADALLKLSTEEIQVNIIHKGVGAITDSDILLAAAASAIVIGFQVRPSASTRKLAEKEGIEIRLYAIIYDAINSIRDAMQGMLAPSIEEVITGNATVRQVFEISKIGTVAGCYVTEGYIKKANPIRLIRDSIVIHTGSISQLKRFKEEVQEVKSGFECGISISNFNGIQANDTIESFEKREVARSL